MKDKINICYNVYLPVGVWVSLQRRGAGLSSEKSNRGQGGSERKKADLCLAVRHKGLNYTVKESQE